MTQTLTSAQRALCTATLSIVARLGGATARRNPTVPRDDLEGVGREALVVAALRYDPTIGPFEPYAIYFVRGEMLNHVRKTLRTRARERRAPLALIAGHPLDEKSPADKLQEALERTTEMDREEIVLEMRLRAAGACAELDGHPPDSDSEDAQLARRVLALGRQVLEEAAAALDEPDRTVYQRFYQEERSLDEIAVELGRSKRTVQRIGERVKSAIDAAVRRAKLM